MKYHKVDKPYWAYTVNGWEVIRGYYELEPRTGNELTKEEVAALWSARLKEALKDIQIGVRYISQ